jgi:hypothetical protein
MCNAQKNDTRQHPFEKAGFGHGPYTYVGCREETFQACPGAPIKAGGTCDYCGNGIRFKFDVVSADGVKFGVGCDCVNKLYSHLNKATIERDPIYRKIQDDRRERMLIARHAREEATYAKLWAFCFQHLTDLHDLPHSKSWAAEQGKTRFDEFFWWMHNAGMSGKLKFMRAMKKHFSGK